MKTKTGIDQTKFAEFMGAKWVYQENYKSYAWKFEISPSEYASKWWDSEALQYSSDYNWFLPVYKKIKNSHENMLSSKDKDYSNWILGHIQQHILNVEIEEACKHAVIWIDFYNDMKI